jgi:hypothetical protein
MLVISKDNVEYDTRKRHLQLELWPSDRHFLYDKYANIMEPNDNILSDVLFEIQVESCYLHISNTI